MGDIAGYYTSPYSSPYISYNISYSQIGRNGSSSTYRFNVGVSLGSSSSSFGYSLAGYFIVNGARADVTFKGTERWTGTTVHNFTVDVTASAGSGGGTLNAEFHAYRPSSDGTAGIFDVGGTVSLSTWNTAPYWSGGSCSVSPSGTIPESTSSLSVSWSSASDTEGNTLYYTVQRYVNGSLNATIASNTTSTSVTDNISAGNQGYSYYYVITVNDGSLWASSSLQSNTVTKNVFTGATLATSSSIAYGTGSISFSYSGIKNTNGNASFGYSLSCSNITVYNPSASPTSVTIYKSGTVPSSTYIKFDDIKNVTASNNYTGTFTFTLNSWNGYGSSAYSSVNMWVDVRTNPSTVGTISISGSYSIGSTSYYIPNRKNITLSWSASSDPLGGSVNYDVQGKLGNGSFTTLQSNLTSTNTSVGLSQVSSRQSYVFRIVAKTSYGTNSTTDSSSITLDYYNPPTIVYTNVSRGLNNVAITATVNINSSITGLTISSASYVGKSGSSTSISSPTSPINVSETGLTDTQSYTFTLTVQDSAGAVIGTTATSQSYLIGRYTPMLSIRELGVGVNALADSTYKFVVGGNAKIIGNLALTASNGTATCNHDVIKTYYGDGNGFSVAIEGGALTAIGSGESAQLTLNSGNTSYTDETMYVTSDNDIRFESNLQNGWASRKEMTFDISGVLNVPTISTGNISCDTITLDNTLSEKEVIGSGNSRWGMYLGVGGMGFYDWTNNRGIISYDPSANAFYISRTTSIGGSSTTITSGNLTINKNGYSSIINFPAQTNDAGFIEHNENNNTAYMKFVASDDFGTVDYFTFGSQSGASYYEGAWIYTNGNIGSNSSITARGGLLADRVHGLSNTEQVYIGTQGYTYVESGSGAARFHYDAGNYILITSSGMTIYFNSVGKHAFWTDGTKAGGSIEVDGMNYGMSPIDSPRVLIQDIMYDMDVQAEGTIIYLDDILSKILEGYAVFPNCGSVQITEKTNTYFKVEGYTGKVDFNIIGNRINKTQQYFELMQIPDCREETQSAEIVSPTQPQL